MGVNPGAGISRRYDHTSLIVTRSLSDAQGYAHAKERQQCNRGGVRTHRGIRFNEPLWGCQKLDNDKVVITGLGFSFQLAITVRRQSLIRHSNAPSARTLKRCLAPVDKRLMKIPIMGFDPFFFSTLRKVRGER